MACKRWTIIYWVIILSLIIYLIAIQPSKKIELGLIMGEPPKNTPVMLYWVRDDGTITAESAIRTDYAGILPHSTTGHRVPYQVYTDYIGYKKEW